MTDARQDKFYALLVWASDRLARSVIHFLQVLDELGAPELQVRQLP